MAVSRRLRFEILRRDGHTCRYCGAKAPDVTLTVDHVIPVALGGSDEPANLVTACDACNGGKSSVAPDSPIVEDVARDALRWKRAIEQAQLEFAAERELIDAACEAFDAEWRRWTYTEHVKVPAPLVEPTGDPLIDNWHRLHDWQFPRDAEPVSFVDGVMSIRVLRGNVSVARKYLAGVTIRRQWAAVLGAPVVDVHIEVADSVTPPPRQQHGHSEQVRRHHQRSADWTTSIERFLSNGLTIDDLVRFVPIAMGGGVDKWAYFCGICWRRITDLQESARRIIEAES